jgi:hypothetical protein
VVVKLLLWNLNERDKNTFASQPGLPRGWETALVTRNNGHIQLIHDEGFSAKKFNVQQKKELELAISETAELLSGAIEELKPERLFVLVVPFWYKLAVFRAIEELALWHMTCAPDIWKQSTGVRFVQLAAEFTELPNGIIHSPELSRPRGRKRTSGAMMDTPLLYSRMPRKYRYLEYNNVVELPEDDMMKFLPAPTQASVDWGSFMEDEDEDESFGLTV